jgi:hypothetical protein
MCSEANSKQENLFNNCWFLQKEIIQVSEANSCILKNYVLPFHQKERQMIPREMETRNIISSFLLWDNWQLNS